MGCGLALCPWRPRVHCRLATSAPLRPAQQPRCSQAADQKQYRKQHYCCAAAAPQPPRATERRPPPLPPAYKAGADTADVVAAAAVAAADAQAAAAPAAVAMLLAGLACRQQRLPQHLPHSRRWRHCHRHAWSCWRQRAGAAAARPRCAGYPLSGPPCSVHTPGLLLRTRPQQQTPTRHLRHQRLHARHAHAWASALGCSCALLPQPLQPQPLVEL